MRGPKDIRDFSTPVEYEFHDGYRFLVLRYAEPGAETGETLPCPFCGRVHQHGGTGHRRTHCISTLAGSGIHPAKTAVFAPDGVPVYRDVGYLVRTREYVLSPIPLDYMQL